MLIDAEMPVIVVAPNNELLEKLKSNIEEVRARGGELYVFADGDAGFNGSDNMHIIEMPHVEESIAPIFYTVPLQLLAYHVALIKGTDVDQPRNLAKSVTVEYRIISFAKGCRRRPFFIFTCCFSPILCAISGEAIDDKRSFCSVISLS